MSSNAFNTKYYDSNEDLITRIAWLYYREKLTQQQIAEYTSLSRSKVQRLLERSRDMEIVSFHVKHPYHNLLSIERKLVKRYDLEDAVVIPKLTVEENQLHQSFSKACSSYLERSAATWNDIVIGLGWGTTISRLGDFFNPPPTKTKLKVVSLMGNLMTDVAMNPYITAEKIATKLGAPFYNIWAPAITQTKQRADSFKAEPWIKDVIDIAGGSNLAIVTIGGLSKSDSLYKMGYLCDDDLNRLKKKDAAGNILCRFIDKQGHIVDDPLHDRVIAVSIKKLKENNTKVIAVSGGQAKFYGIMAAVKGGYVDVLITDEEIAKRMVNSKS